MQAHVDLSHLLRRNIDSWRVVCTFTRVFRERAMPVNNNAHRETNRKHLDSNFQASQAEPNFETHTYPIRIFAVWGEVGSH